MPTGQNNHKGKSFDEGSLRQLLIVVSTLYWAKRKVTITIPLLFAIFGYFYAKKIAKPTYLAEYTLNVGHSNSLNSGSFGIASSLGLFNMGSTNNSGNTIASYISSRDNFESVFREIFNEEEVIDFLQSNSSEDRPAESHLNGFKLDQRFQDSLVGHYSKEMSERNLTVFYDKKNSIISIEFRHLNEDFCLFLATKLVQNAQDYFLEGSLDQMATSIQELKSKVDSSQIAISNTILELAKFSDQSNSLISNVSAVEKSGMIFRLETSKLTYVEYLKALEMARANKRSVVPPFKYFDAPRLPLKKERLSAKKAVVLGGMLSGFIILLIIVLVNRNNLIE